MKKLYREIERAITSTGVTILDRRNHQGHLQFDIKTPTGIEHTITTAGSPKIKEHTIAAVLRDVRRLL